MWLITVRPPLPDIPYWPGRRVLALLDAVIWPSLVALWVENMPRDARLVGQVVIALCVLHGLRQAGRALWDNGQYRFTTLKVLKVVGMLMVVGAVLKLTV